MSSHHVQEPTLVSISETLHNTVTPHSDDDNESPISRFTGYPTLNSTSPDPVQHEHPKHEKTIDPRSFPKFIPPEHEHRTLVLCFDGTGDQFDADNSNIVQLCSTLKKNDRNKQMVYYQAGIGTYTPSKPATAFWAHMQKTLDEMLAWNLDGHVMSGYEFLMQNYIEGDKICIFGFSRGAYTARSLAGMLHKVGLLPADNHQQVPFAYKMYTRVDHIGWEQSNGFKKAFCIDVNIDFLGVWDTVDSVGLIPRRLPFTTSNTIVKTFRHAVSLDERRAKFKANLWNRPTSTESELGVRASRTPRSAGLTKESSPERESDKRDNTGDSEKENKAPSTPLSFNFPSSTKSAVSERSTMNLKGRKGSDWRDKISEDDRKLNSMERMYSEKKKHESDIEEVWFAGCHCDVGGGAVSNKTRYSLARIPLRWMIRECFKANTGIMFEAEALIEIGLDPATLYPIVLPRPPPLLPKKGEHKVRQHPKAEIPVRLHATLKKKGEETVQHLSGHGGTGKESGTGTEEEEELQDALSPAYDQLKIKKVWWVLEILPLLLRYQRGNNQWVSYYGSNMAKPRFIPRQYKNGVKVHRSVQIRMEAEYEDEKKAQKGKRYKPKVELRVEPTWID